MTYGPLSCLLLANYMPNELRSIWTYFYNIVQGNAERAKDAFYEFYVHGPGRNLNYNSLFFQES